MKEGYSFKKEPKQICSRNKICVGSINDDFIYSDGTKDKGRIIYKCQARYPDGFILNFTVDSEELEEKLKKFHN